MDNTESCFGCSLMMVIVRGVSEGKKSCLNVWACINKEGSKNGMVLFVEVGLIGVGVIAKDWGVETEILLTSFCCKWGSRGLVIVGFSNLVGFDFGISGIRLKTGSSSLSRSVSLGRGFCCRRVWTCFLMGRLYL